MYFDEDWEDASEEHAKPELRRPSLTRLLRPESIAIVGASPYPRSLGQSVLCNLERSAYSGTIYPVNPKYAEIHGRACVSSIEELPSSVDCAVLAIPKTAVKEAVQSCVRRNVGAIVIFAAGFAENGREGRAEQEEIGSIAREHCVAMLGPNCLGLVNGIDGIPLTFVPVPVGKLIEPRGVAVVSQSGALAAVLGTGLRHHGLGLSFSISTGNEAASSVEDYVEYLIGDDRTQVIVLIVEQFRQRRHFLQLAARGREQGKYLVLLHPGRGKAARLSAATHTGALAGDYEVMRAKVEQAGAVVVETLEELLDVSKILMCCRPLPQGGAAVITESGAFKALTLDLCEAVGLALPPLSSETAEALRQTLPGFVVAANPLDVTGHGLVDPEIYKNSLRLLLADEQYGSVVLAIIVGDESTSALKLAPILDVLKEGCARRPLMLAALDEGAELRLEFVEQLRQRGVPFFPSSERVFRALARVTKLDAKHDIAHPQTKQDQV